MNGGHEKKSTAKNDYQPNNKNINNEAIWEDNTTLIIGDSMIYGLEEEKMKRKTKIRMFRGSTIDDMYHYMTPLLQKKPKNIILHVGTNNCVKDNSEQIVDKLRNLKDYINSILPKTKVIFSSLITRLDDAKARLAVLMTNKKIMNLGIMEIINNDNINEIYLGKKGLHGTGKLAVNFINCVKTLL